MESSTFSPENSHNPLDDIRKAIEAVRTPEDVDEVAFLALESDPVAQEYGRLVDDARRNKHPKTEKRLVDARKEMLRGYQVKIALETGVEIETMEHKEQREECREKISDIVNSIDPSSPKENIMEALGILTPVEGRAKYRFSFPSKIFPPYIREQWEAYIEVVDQFEVAAAKAADKLIANEQLAGVDVTRGNAHNTVSDSIAEVLQFPGWELEDYRNFVAKMRDHKYAVSMGELARYGGALRQEFYSGGDDQIQLKFEKEDLVRINQAMIEYKKGL